VCGKGRKGHCLFSQPSASCSRADPRENGSAELGEELLNPQVEGLLRNPKVMTVVDQDPGNGNVGRLALDDFFVDLAVGKSGGVLQQEEAGQHWHGHWQSIHPSFPCPVETIQHVFFG